MVKATKYSTHKAVPRKKPYGAYLKQTESLNTSVNTVTKKQEKFKYEEGDMIRQLRMLQEDWVEDKGCYTRKDKN